MEQCKAWLSGSRLPAIQSMMFGLLKIMAMNLSVWLLIKSSAVNSLLSFLKVKTKWGRGYSIYKVWPRSQSTCKKKDFEKQSSSYICALKAFIVGQIWPWGQKYLFLHNVSLLEPISKRGLAKSTNMHSSFELIKIVDHNKFPPDNFTGRESNKDRGGYLHKDHRIPL